MNTMPTGIQNLKLAVNFIKEGKSFVAYSPALDLSTAGKSQAEAKKRFEEAVSMFFSDIVERGVIAEVLKSLGWKNSSTNSSPRWQPPQVVSKFIDVSVPIPA